MNSRTLKQEKQILPISLDIVKTNNCFSKLNYKNNKFSYFNNTCNNENFKKYIYTPPITISTELILNIYNINTINDLLTFIDDNIDNLNYLKINRILNSWITMNFETLKINKLIFDKIYIKIMETYFGTNMYAGDEFKQKVYKYIDYWITANNPNQFNIDLLGDILKYIYNNNIK